MAGRIQGADLKTYTEIETLGGVSTAVAKSLLPDDDKIYVTANGINKTLKEAITDGDIGAGSGGGLTKYEKVTGQTGTTVTFTETYTLSSIGTVIFRNGIKMNKVVSFTPDAMEYQEATTTTITLDAAYPAVSDDVFELLVFGTGSGGGGSGSGSGSDLGDVLQQLGEEELVSLSSVLPNQIIDAFNDDTRGTKTNMAASADALRFSGSNLTGSYNRKLAASLPCSNITGVSVHSPQQLRPKNGQTVPMTGASQAIVFSGDVTNFFADTKKVLIAKFLADSETYADGQNRFQFIPNADQTAIAEFSISGAPSYNSGTDETTITVTNLSPAVDLASGVGTNDLNSKMAVIPWDYQYSVRSLSSETLEQMLIKDAFLSDVVRLPGENFFAELGSLTGSVTKFDGQMSPSKQYGLVRVRENQAANLRIWHWFWTADSGRTWTKFSTTKSFTDASTAFNEENDNNPEINTPFQIAVADNGKAFSTWSLVNGSGYHAIRAVYSDLSAGTPALTDTATNAAGAVGANKGAGYVADGTTNSYYAWVAADLTDLSFIAVFCRISSSNTPAIVWYTNGGATFDSDVNAAFSHSLTQPLVGHITGTGVSHRTHVVCQNDSNGAINHIYWNQGSTSSVATTQISASTSNGLMGGRGYGNRIYGVYSDSSGHIEVGYMHTLSGTPTAGTARRISFNSGLTRGTQIGANTAQAKNYNKIAERILAVNPSDEKHIMVTLDIVHDDSVERSQLYEIKDVDTFKGIQVSSYSNNSAGTFNSVSTNQRIGQVFTASNTRIRSAWLRLYRNGQTATGNLSLHVYNTSGGLPTTLVASSINAVPAMSITNNTSFQVVYWQFDDAALNNLTGTYALVLTSDAGFSTSESFAIRRSTLDPYAGGTAVYYDGSSWSVLSGTEDFNFEISGEWVEFVGRASYGWTGSGDDRTYDQESQLELIDSNQVQHITRTAFRSLGNANLFPMAGHPYRRIITWGTTNKSVVSDSVIAGYAESNFDEYLQFSVALGSDACKRRSTTTGVLDDNSAGEERSGHTVAIGTYGNITSADTVVDGSFEAGVAIDFNGTDEYIQYSDRPEFDVFWNKSFIMEMELKPTLATSGYPITQYNFPTNYGWNLLVRDDGSVSWIARNTGGSDLCRTDTTTGFLTANTYAVLRVVYDGSGGQIRIYKSSSPSGVFTEATYNGGVTINFSSGNTAATAPLEIGRRNDPAGYFPGRIGYVKFANGISSFNYVGFKNQAPLTEIQNLGTRILCEQNVGFNSSTLGNTFDDVGVVDAIYANEASVVDSYDVIAQFEHTLVGAAGNELELNLDAARVSTRDQSSIQGLNFRFS